jgi:hypothetical protein
VPTGVDALVVTVTVEFAPLLVGVMLAGFGVQLDPDGCPVQVSETVPLKPLIAVPVTVNVPELPASTVKLPGFASKANSAAFTVSAGFTVNCSLPDVPVTTSA